MTLSKYERKGPAKKGEDKNLVRFGAHVRALREKLEIDQYVLAERCERTQAWVSQVENGKMNVTLTALLALAKALRVPVVELLAW